MVVDYFVLHRCLAEDLESVQKYKRMILSTEIPMNNFELTTVTSGLIVTCRSGHNFRLRLSSAALANSSCRCCSANGNTARYRAYGLTNLICAPLFAFFPSPFPARWKTLIVGPFTFSLPITVCEQKLVCCIFPPINVGRSSRNSVLPDKSCGQYS